MMNIDSLDLPERVKRIVNGVGAAEEGCDHCHQQSVSLSRCSRCKVAKYCSEACQREHFSIHKKNCKCIKKEREILVGVEGGEELARKSIALADRLVKTGYHESDTIAQAVRYFREALEYYLLPMTAFPEYLSTFPWVEDRILLLLLALGGDHNTVKDWCMSKGSERMTRCYVPANELDREGDWDVYCTDLEDGAVPEFELAGYATNDVTFQAIQLLGLLRQFSDYYAYSEKLQLYRKAMETAPSSLGENQSTNDIINHIAAFLMGGTECSVAEDDGKGLCTKMSSKFFAAMSNLMDRIGNVAASIAYHGMKHGDFTERTNYLLSLMEGTFEKTCAPNMFGGGEGNLPNYFFVPGGDCGSPLINRTPPEFWLIVRDMFIQSELKVCLLSAIQCTEHLYNKSEDGTVSDEDEY